MPKKKPEAYGTPPKGPSGKARVTFFNNPLGKKGKRGKSKNAPQDAKAVQERYDKYKKRVAKERARNKAKLEQKEETVSRQRERADHQTRRRDLYKEAGRKAYGNMKSAQREGMAALERATAAQENARQLNQRLQKEQARATHLKKGVGRANELLNKTKSERQRLQKEFEEMRQSKEATGQQLSSKKAELEAARRNEATAQQTLSTERERFNSKMEEARSRERELHNKLQEAQREAAEQRARAERSTGQAEDLRQQMSVNTNLNAPGAAAAMETARANGEINVDALRNAGLSDAEIQGMVREGARKGWKVIASEKKEEKKKSSDKESAEKDKAGGAKTWDARAAEIGTNLNAGIGGFFASGAFLNILFVIVIILLIYIVLQFFAFV